MRAFVLHIVSFALLGFATAVLAKTVAFQPCPVSAENAVADCVVHEVRIEPCTVISRGFCHSRRGRRVRFSFDFTPNFSGEDLQSRVIWKHYYQDLPMDSTWQDLNPCNSTTCPVTAGIRQTYNRTFTTDGGSFPKNYRLESKLWNVDNKSCCFIFTISITR